MGHTAGLDSASVIGSSHMGFSPRPKCQLRLGGKRAGRCRKQFLRYVCLPWHACRLDFRSSCNCPTLAFVLERPFVARLFISAVALLHCAYGRAECFRVDTCWGLSVGTLDE